MMLLDHVQPRGEFTIYSRIAGSKVPQIYGPSADEPGSPAIAGMQNEARQGKRASLGGKILGEESLR